MFASNLVVYFTTGIELKVYIEHDKSRLVSKLETPCLILRT